MGQHLLEDAGDIALDVVESARTVAQQRDDEHAQFYTEPGWIGVGGAVLLFLEEMVGGAAVGVAGGWALAQSLKRLPIETPLAPVLVLTGGLAVFGLAQLIGTSASWQPTWPR